MFDLISEGLAKHLVMPMGGHNVGVFPRSFQETPRKALASEPDCGTTMGPDDPNPSAVHLPMGGFFP